METLRHIAHLTPLWFYVALVEFFFLLFIITIKFRFQNRNEISQMKKTEIDMPGVFDDLFKSKQLYDILARKCHPDRFIGSANHDLAQRLFQDLSANRRNYKELLRIQVEIENQLMSN